MPRKGAAFLDRDGTLNAQPPEGCYVRRPSDLELLPGATSAIRMLNRHGIPVVLATNQRWLSFPGASFDEYRAVDQRLRDLLAAQSARLDAGYVCPHALNSCNCRKPNPGMLLRGAAELDLDLSTSVMIGDTLADCRAARAAGVRAALVNYSGTDPVPPWTAQFDCLADAASWAVHVISSSLPEAKGPPC